MSYSMNLAVDLFLLTRWQPTQFRINARVFLSFGSKMPTLFKSTSTAGNFAITASEPDALVTFTRDARRR